MLDLDATFAPVVAILDADNSQVQELTQPVPIIRRQSTRQLERPQSVTRPQQYSLYPSDSKTKDTQRKPSTDSNADVRNKPNETRQSESSSRNPSRFAPAQRKPADDSRSSGNSKPRLNGKDDSGPISRQASFQGLQARVGSVTKRFSALNMGKKGVKGSLKSPNIERVAED